MGFLSRDDEDPYNPRNNIAIGVTIAMVAGGIFFFVNNSDMIFGSGKGRDNARLERELRMGADMVNRMAPQRIDEVTTLTGARVQGHEFVYLYSVTDDVRANELAAASADLDREMKPRLCSDPGLRRIVQMGGTIAAEFRDASGDQIRATVRDCAGVGAGTGAGTGAVPPSGRTPVPKI